MRTRCVFTLVLLGLLGADVPAQTVGRSATGPASGASRVTVGGGAGGGPSIKVLSPVKAYVRANNREKLVTLVGRGEKDKSKVAFTDPSAPNKRLILDADMIEAVRFDLDIDNVALTKARYNLDWLGVARVILGAVKPALPYLDLVENTAAELVLEAGDALLRSAEKLLRAAETDAQRAAASKRYEAAYAVLKQARAAEWSSVSTIAWLKSLRCLLMLDKPKTARHYFKDIAEPFPGDRAMGLYWLVKAELEMNRQEYRVAMDAAVRSVAFENKDVDTFPDALLVTAQCYEELQEWHRARDVYYEVARIFPYTDWAAVSTRRLHFIMDNELTAAKEVGPIANVFFGLSEDMNAVVKTFLAEGPGEKAPEYVEPEEEEEEKLTEDELEERLEE
jgi:hypothetical protein